MTKNDSRWDADCEQDCIEQYLACLQRKYTGGVETLRVCREKCVKDDEKMETDK